MAEQNLDDLGGVHSPEKIKVERFSEEQREALQKEGYSFFTLRGLSMKDFVNEGKKILGYEDGDIERSILALAAYPSMMSEVAIKLGNLYLPRSNMCSLEDKTEMVRRFSEEYLNKIIPGVKAIIGQIPDYLDIGFQHFDATEGKDPLFTRENDSGYTVANVPFFPLDEPEGHVGFSSLYKSFVVILDEADHFPFKEDLWACPLVVPASLKLDQSPFEAYEAHRTARLAG
ncbi:MAG: hypothetical protein A2815_01055 [Candidatus Portnoybacteria bacterium RIFCSPHIGHO2_01_FULL_40_12b]|uniref:Uncharacterized protein n=1 Tax=Candidatus Portnoybacteria bacterium RIFCSPHIGHO2_01_FULL_40_12b TaxID=1801994 RepID=A0A1G2FAT5_9BACT|nr:MAG: hypothetical protein A2815_01055 [Candidatus Portnoybacteria bacterium RIFCSPHIGHO2_01_FULL_40_12b]